MPCLFVASFTGNNVADDQYVVINRALILSQYWRLIDANGDFCSACSTKRERFNWIAHARLMQMRSLIRWCVAAVCTERIHDEKCAVLNMDVSVVVSIDNDFLLISYIAIGCGLQRIGMNIPSIQWADCDQVIIAADIQCISWRTRNITDGNRFEVRHQWTLVIIFIKTDSCSRSVRSRNLWNVNCLWVKGTFFVCTQIHRADEIDTACVTARNLSDINIVDFDR